MPAGINQDDHMFSVREVPWHGLGAVLDKAPDSIEEAIHLSGLAWDVVQKPIAYHSLNSLDEPTFTAIPGYFANVRSDTGASLGIVSRRYSPVQNIEAFSFLSGIFQSEMHFETAGSLMNGRRVWVMLKIPDYIEVGGDAIGQYAFIENAHDGKRSITAAVTPIRIVCQNTVTAAVRLAHDYNADRTYTLRHLGNMQAKMENAANVLRVTVNYYEQFKALGDLLAMAIPSQADVRAYLSGLFPITDQTGERQRRNREAAREQVQLIFEGHGPDGDTTGNSPRSWWSLYNAAVEHADWMREERKDGGRFQRAIDDPGSFKANAFDLALGGAGL
jgi:phage/plasmid-like protein (TIGR03299 family)